MNDKPKASIIIIFCVLALSMMIGTAIALPVNQDDQAAELPYKHVVTTRFIHALHGNCTAATGDWIFWQASFPEGYENIIIIELTVDGQLVEVELSEAYEHPERPGEWFFDANYISPPLPKGEHRFDFHLELVDDPQFSYDSSVWVFVVPRGSINEIPTGPTNPASMNARFVKWREKPHIIHIFRFDDEGRPGQPPAQVAEGHPVLFGFEFGGESVEQLREQVIDNPDHDILLSIDGGEPFSIKSWYQIPFVAVPHLGPAWSWDHDSDGLGDGDDDGIGDWEGSVLFFRYQSGGLTKGTHTFEFDSRFGNDVTWDLITIIAG